MNAGPLISLVTGEVAFQDGLHIRADDSINAVIASIREPAQLATIPLSIPRWRQHRLGLHPSAYGDFEVEAISGPAGRVHLVLLAHADSFYEESTPEDAVRRVFHEGVIAAELGGQREFSWGEVFRRLERDRSKDWLIVSYAQGPHVPRPPSAELLKLRAHEPEPAHYGRTFQVARIAKASPARERG